MPSLIADVSWATIEGLRERIAMVAGAPTVEVAANQLASELLAEFPSIVLARVFTLTAFAQLPARDRAAVETFAARANKVAQLSAATLVLSLLGTRGREPAWNERAKSVGHLAIPLLDREVVDGAPMIAALLRALDLEVAALETAPAIATRRMVGVRNARFFIDDAQTAVDSRGAHIIASREFVANYDVHTVFGMGGAYVDGRLVVALVFTTERVETLVVDRFPSLISNFKMATERLVQAGRIYGDT